MNAGIYIPKDLKPYPKDHELLSARALAKAGYSVVFLQPENRPGAKSADILLDGIAYEMKAPQGTLKSIERNLKRAVRQSRYIVFDSRRMKIKQSAVIQREIVYHLKKQRIVNSLLFINRYGNVIDLTLHR